MSKTVSLETRKAFENALESIIKEKIESAKVYSLDELKDWDEPIKEEN